MKKKNCEKNLCDRNLFDDLRMLLLNFNFVKIHVINKNFKVD